MLNNFRIQESCVTFECLIFAIPCLCIGDAEGAGCCAILIALFSALIVFATLPLSLFFTVKVFFSFISTLFFNTSFTYYFGRNPTPKRETYILDLEFFEINNYVLTTFANKSSWNPSQDFCIISHLLIFYCRCMHN